MKADFRIEVGNGCSHEISWNSGKDSVFVSKLSSKRAHREFPKVFSEAMNADAARVQLLAKALMQARAELAREGCLQEVKAIDRALAEAGTESESK